MSNMIRFIRNRIKSNNAIKSPIKNASRYLKEYNASNNIGTKGVRQYDNPVIIPSPNKNIDRDPSRVANYIKNKNVGNKVVNDGPSIGRPEFLGKDKYVTNAQVEAEKVKSVEAEARKKVDAQLSKEAKKAEKLKSRSEKFKRAKFKAGVGAAGLYVGMDTMDRYQNGGNLTRNPEGKKDLMGIPFL